LTPLIFGEQRRFGLRIKFERIEQSTIPGAWWVFQTDSSEPVA